MTNTQTEKQKQSLDEEFEHERTAQEDRKARHMLIHNTITPRELQQPKQNPELKQTNKTGLKEKERFTTLRTKDSHGKISVLFRQIELSFSRAKLEEVVVEEDKREAERKEDVNAFLSTRGCLIGTKQTMGKEVKLLSRQLRRSEEREK